MPRARACELSRPAAVPTYTTANSKGPMPAGADGMAAPRLAAVTMASSTSGGTESPSEVATSAKTAVPVAQLMSVRPSAATTRRGAAASIRACPNEPRWGSTRRAGPRLKRATIPSRSRRTRSCGTRVTVSSTIQPRAATTVNAPVMPLPSPRLAAAKAPSVAALTRSRPRSRAIEPRARSWPTWARVPARCARTNSPRRPGRTMLTR